MSTYNATTYAKDLKAAEGYIHGRERVMSKDFDQHFSALRGPGLEALRQEYGRFIIYRDGFPLRVNDKSSVTMVEALRWLVTSYAPTELERLRGLEDAKRSASPEPTAPASWKLPEDYDRYGPHGPERSASPEAYRDTYLHDCHIMLQDLHMSFFGRLPDGVCVPLHPDVHAAHLGPKEKEEAHA